MSRLEEFFRRYLNFIEGTNLIEEKKVKRDLIKQAFSKEMLTQRSDEEFVEALKEALSSLWAIKSLERKGVNLDDHIQNIIQKNGVEKLRINFYELIYGSKDLKVRFDKFLENVDRLGVASVTEILCFIDPKKYAVWNRKVVSAINKLGLLKGLTEALGLQSAHIENKIVNINGRQYVEVIKFLDDQIKKKLENLAGREVDFLELNYFLYYVVENVEEAETLVAREEERRAIASHEEAQYYLLKLGQLLGYATHVARQDKSRRVNNEMLGEVANVRQLPEWLTSYPSIRDPESIDVLWLDPTESVIYYAFEVSHTSEIIKDVAALLDFTLMAKSVFIVAPDDRRGEFERLRRSPVLMPLLEEGKLRFLSYSELLNLYERVRDLRELLDEVGIQIWHPPLATPAMRAPIRGRSIGL